MFNNYGELNCSYSGTFGSIHWDTIDAEDCSFDNRIVWTLWFSLYAHSLSLFLLGFVEYIYISAYKIQLVRDSTHEYQWQMIWAMLSATMR